MDGFVKRLPASEYHAHESISKSGLDLIAKSPAHYKCRASLEPTQAMIIGTAIHTAILEPDRFESEYCFTDAKDRRATSYKEAVQDYGVENVLLPSDANNVRKIQEASLSRPDIRNLAHAEGDAELSAFATDPETGVKVRCRYDRLASAGFAVDIKKARDISDRGFARSCATYRYHVQVAFYSDIYEWITGERLSEFWLIAIEESEPYTVVPYRLDDLSIEAGRLAYRRDLNTYAHCLEMGEWPHYEPESNLIALPDWALADLDDQLEIMV